MRYEILFAPEAVRDLKVLKAHLRSAVLDAIERHLRHQPRRLSKSRIKRLQGLAKPQYRLRAGEARVFYDVEEATVHVLAIVLKPQANEWLREAGEPK